MIDSTLPLVSVYMPTKNRIELLKRAIQSIKEQTYPNIELLIVDDGSTDDTYAYLTKLSKTMSNLSIFRHEQSIGACAARNLAIKNAQGEFVTGLDDDDLFLPNRISSLMAAYDDKYAFVCSSMWWDYGAKKRLIDGSEFTFSLAEQLSYNEATSQILVKRERVLKLNGFDETFVACQDYDLFTRLIEIYGSARRIASPTYIVNDTGSSERMISSPKSVKGYEQFLEKFQYLMSDNNKKNQAFMRLRRERKAMPFFMLLQQMGSGHFQAKWRYYLSSNFAVVRKLHDKFYK